MDRRDGSAGPYHPDATTAWILNDDESSRAWMDDELALHRQQVTAATVETFKSDQAQLRKTQSEGSDYQKKFAKKRRPSLNGGRTKNKRQTFNYSPSSLYFTNDDENDDDNNTISTLSTASMIMLDDRDATAASSLSPTDESRQEHGLHHHHHHHREQQQPEEDDTARKEIDRVVQHMLYQCHISVVEDPPIETTMSPKRAIRNVSSMTSENSATKVAATTTTMLTPPKIRKNRKMSSSSSSSKSKTLKRTKKSVTFHKYDQVIHASRQMEYVYSLYQYEAEREKQEYDVVDEFENAVRDVGYFFQCLQQGISEDVTSTFSRPRRKRSLTTR